MDLEELRLQKMEFRHRMGTRIIRRARCKTQNSQVLPNFDIQEWQGIRKGFQKEWQQ
jgi:hypothetical protein